MVNETIFSFGFPSPSPLTDATGDEGSGPRSGRLSLREEEIWQGEREEGWGGRERRGRW